MSHVFATLFAAAYALILLLSYRFRHWKYTVWILIGFAFAIRLYLSSMEEVLNTWDEQFHALVAKNMTEDPFRPRLYRENILQHEYWDWAGNYIWLHKPPLFLWIIALSIKIFGTSVLAVRLPSIILSCVSIGLIARMARKMKDDTAAWWATVLLSLNPFVPVLITGRMPTDHNDVIFSFFITLSYYLYYQYRQHQRIRDLVFLALAVSACILNKWLLGLWIFIPFGVYVVQNKFRLRPVLHLAGTLIASLILPLAWYLYIHFEFPKEAAHEMAYNARHFFEPLEGHRGTFFYPFQWLPAHYGILGTLIVIAGLVSMAKRSVGTFAGVVFVYLFFAVAATKMPAFTFWIAPVLLLYGGIFLSSALMKLKEPAVRITAIALLLGGLSLEMKPGELYNEETLENVVRKKIASQTVQFQGWADSTDTRAYVVSDLPEKSHIRFMFYTDALGYDRPLTEAERKRAENAGKKVVRWEEIEW